MSNSVSFLPKAGLNTMLENAKQYDKLPITKLVSAEPPTKLPPASLMDMVKFNEQFLQKVKHELHAGKYYPGKYLNILV